MWVTQCTDLGETQSGSRRGKHTNKSWGPTGPKSGRRKKYGFMSAKISGIRTKTKRRRLLLKPTWHHRGSAFGGKNSFRSLLCLFVSRSKRSFKQCEKAVVLVLRGGTRLELAFKGKWAKNLQMQKRLKRASSFFLIRIAEIPYRGWSFWCNWEIGKILFLFVMFSVFV